MFDVRVSPQPAPEPPPMTTADPLTPVAARPADRFVPYLEASGYPLTSLLFVIPLMVAYELGTQWYASDPVTHVQQRIVAFNLMRSFFDRFGVTGMYFPPATVASILFAWHLARADAFAARPGVLVGMLLESAMYAVPLVGLGYAFQHYLPLHLPCASPYGAVGTNARALVVLSIGAGVYEELIFRLVAFTVLHALLVDVCRVPKAIGRSDHGGARRRRVFALPLPPLGNRTFPVGKLCFPHRGGHLFWAHLRHPRLRFNCRRSRRLRRAHRPAQGDGDGVTADFS